MIRIDTFKLSEKLEIAKSLTSLSIAVGHMDTHKKVAHEAAQLAFYILKSAITQDGEDDESNQ